MKTEEKRIVKEETGVRQHPESDTAKRAHANDSTAPAVPGEMIVRAADGLNYGLRDIRAVSLLLEAMGSDLATMEGPALGTREALSMLANRLHDVHGRISRAGDALEMILAERRGEAAS
jgi:hypothetical protein